MSVLALETTKAGFEALSQTLIFLGTPEGQKTVAYWRENDANARAFFAKGFERLERLFPEPKQ